MLKMPDKSLAKKLREIYTQETILMPGVFNAISAVAAEKSGAKALYLSGAGVTNSLLGVPDIALINQTEMSQQASYACQVTNLPLIADADTGYGEAINIKRTVIEMEKSGLAGIHLEDQESPKRCGHLDGKSVVSPQIMAQKIRAAVDSKTDSDFIIIARTDARSVEGLPKAIDRAKLYADSGADMIFPEGLENIQEFEDFRKKIHIPLLANMTEFGKTPHIPFSQFQNIGYNIVIFPMTAFRVMLKSLCDTYQSLIENGTAENLIEKMKTRQELYEIIEYDRYNLLDQNWSKEGSLL